MQPHLARMSGRGRPTMVSWAAAFLCGRLTAEAPATWGSIRSRGDAVRPEF
jgi:hypothetical protein